MNIPEFINFEKSFPNIKSENELILILEDLFLKINYSLNKSILEGEYQSNLNSAEEYRAGLESFARVAQDYMHIPNVKRENINDFSEILEYIINLYYLFTSKIIKLYNGHILEYIDKEIFINNSNTLYGKYESFILLINNNIELSKIDHSFVNDESLLKELFKLKNNITNIRIRGDFFSDSNFRNSFTNLKDALLIKVNFLIDKWYIRCKIKLKNNEFKISYFQNIDKYELTDENKLIAFKDKIKYLYELDGFDHLSLLIKKYQNINKSNISNLNFFDLHTLIKFYKDKAEDINGILEVLEVLQNKLKGMSSDNVYEIFAYSLSYQYCLNNYFSIFCSNFFKNSEEINEKNVKDKLGLLHEEYTRVKSKSIDITDNFFIQYKFLNYSFKILEKVFVSKNINEIIALENSSNFFNITLKSALEEYENNIQWSLKNNNYIFKLPFSESYFEFKNHKVYLASSFLLPIAKEDIINDKRQLLNSYQKLVTLFNIEKQLKDLSNIKNKFSKEIDGIKAVFAESNKKLIETVTIFTAIISFIVGSIGAYKFLTTFYEALAFIFTYGLSISIFVLLIFISTKGIESIKKYWVAILFTYIVPVICLFVLLPKNNTEKSKIDNNIKALDSIHQIQKERIDELERLIILKK